MANIQRKKTPKIQKTSSYSYDPATFAKQHKVANFFTVEDPQEILDKIQPFEYRGRRFITFDTETHPYYRSSHDVPKEVVRRWVGKGKQAKPQDFPFVMSFCDGTNAFTIHDSVENGFAKFRQLAPLMEDPTIEKIAHNVKFDAHMYANAGMKIVGKLHDTVVLCKLTNENRNSFQLRDLAARNPRGIVKFEDMVDNYKAINKVTDYRQIPAELLDEYANADVWNAFVKFVEEYDSLVEQDLEDLYNTECEDTIVLYAMERYGMKADKDYEQSLKNDLQRITDEAEQAIYDMAGRTFNINSTKQLYDVLLASGANAAWIPVTDKGNPSLDKDVLGTLATKYKVPIVSKILEFRKNEKLLGTYANGIYEQRDAEYRVHGNINQDEATTGRMSITKPALQTLPKKDKRIRRAFIPEVDFGLAFTDLDQVEYRLFAHYAKIPSLIEAIKNGHDVHAATAAMIFHVGLDELLQHMSDHDTFSLKAKELTERKKNGEAGLDEDIMHYTSAAESLQRYVDMRSKGKTINFALIYGVGTEHLSELLDCTTTEATELKAHYFAQLPEARIFINTVYQVIKQRGKVKNYYGRYRRLDPDDCYKAPNALIQGCAADYIKSKMVRIYKYLQFNKLKTRMINIVHDELIHEKHKDEEVHMPVIRWLLSDFETFRCPITAGYEVGNPSWGQKITPEDIGFKEPESFEFLNYNVFDGHVFDIYKEVA